MKLKIEEFKIQFMYSGKLYTATVAQTFLSDIHERFTVSGGTKSIEIVSDRPLLRNSNSKKKIKMQAVQVKVEFQQAAESIIAQIQQHIYNVEHPPYDWKEHPKNK